MLNKPAISFEQYLKRRDYLFLSFDQALVKTIRKSFSQKSFCGFWRMWNPFSGYLFFRMYSLLGGNKRRPFAIFLIFLFSGLVFHDLPIFLITGGISVIFTVTFSIYSVIFNIEYKLLTRRNKFKSHFLRRNKFPPVYHIVMNMALLALPLVTGFLVNLYFFPDSPLNRFFH